MIAAQTGEGSDGDDAVNDDSVSDRGGDGGGGGGDDADDVVQGPFIVTKSCRHVNVVGACGDGDGDDCRHLEKASKQNSRKKTTATTPELLPTRFSNTKSQVGNQLPNKGRVNFCKL